MDIDRDILNLLMSLVLNQKTYFCVNKICSFFVSVTTLKYYDLKVKVPLADIHFSQH